MSNPEEPCVNCGAPLTGRFCATCGEKRPEPDDLSWKHFCLHALEAFTHADGKILRTLRALVVSPGLLTAEYLRGKRKAYIAPLPLFLICNLAFFLLQPLIHWNTLTTELGYHLYHEDYSDLVRPLVEHKIAARGVTMEAYAKDFDRYVSLEAHALTLMMVPIFFVPVVLLMVWRRRRLVDHLIFSLHFCAFWLLFQLVFLGLTTVVLRVLRKMAYHPAGETIDKVTTVFGMLLLAVYLFFAIRRTYGAGKPAAVAKALTLSFSMWPVLQCYRLVLFFVAYWRT